MNAETIAKALGGRRTGGGWTARCPAHKDRTPSLSIRNADDAKVLVHCYAGCDQNQVIATLRARRLWPQNGSLAFSSPKSRPVVLRERVQSDAKRSEVALAIWQTALPADGTLVGSYLASRGLYLQALPTTLRFHSGLRHPSGSRWPAMVALVTCGSDDKPLAIHRTFLARDGAGKAPVVPSKMMLGPCRGGAVRFGMPFDLLMVGEGIETCLAATQATGHPSWAALSTSGLRALNLPSDVRNVIVLADGDDSGEAAARDCGGRWKREGRRVRIARPPQGVDFNDMLVGRVPRIEEGAQ
jgi:hypothetical protein